MKSVGNGHVDCDDFSDFWIISDYQTLKIGIGHVPDVNRIIFNYNTQAIPLRYVSVSSPENEAEFHISIYDVNCLPTSLPLTTKEVLASDPVTESTTARESTIDTTTTTLPLCHGKKTFYSIIKQNRNRVMIDWIDRFLDNSKIMLGVRL